MSLTSGADPTLGTGASIGRYFSVVSVVPSVILVGWIYALVAAGALSDGPTLKQLVDNNPIAQPWYAAAALAGAVGLAVVGHPIQFALVQFFEGYWPDSRLARGIRTKMVMGHLRRVQLAHSRLDEARRRRAALPQPDSGDLNEYLGPKGLTTHESAARELVDTQAVMDSWQRTAGAYPSNGLATLPTMLGNTLRKHELEAGAAFHLPILKWATHVSMVADPAHTRYVNDQRTQVDLAVRVSAFAYIAAAITFVLLWAKGWPVLLALVPYLAGYVAYRGAVVAANGYGAALRAWVDLNRFRVYDQLGMPVPADSNAERAQNDSLEDLLLGQDVYKSGPYRAATERKNVSPTQAGNKA